MSQHSQRARTHTNHSNIIRTIKIIRFFSNHKAPHYIGCTAFRANAERHHCQHIKVTAFFHYKCHPTRQLNVPMPLWSSSSIFRQQLCHTMRPVRLGADSPEATIGRRCAHLSADWQAAGSACTGLYGAVCAGPAFAWLLAEPRRELAPRGRRFFINVYWSSRENLTDRTAAVVCLRQRNKELHAWWKRFSSKRDIYCTGTVVYTNIFPHAQTVFCSWTESMFG